MSKSENCLNVAIFKDIFCKNIDIVINFRFINFFCDYYKKKCIGLSSFKFVTKTNFQKIYNLTSFDNLINREFESSRNKINHQISKIKK